MVLYRYVNGHKWVIYNDRFLHSEQALFHTGYFIFYDNGFIFSSTARMLVDFTLTSQSCHLYIWPSSSLTNIDVTNWSNLQSLSAEDRISFIVALLFEPCDQGQFQILCFANVLFLPLLVSIFILMIARKRWNGSFHRKVLLKMIVKKRSKMKRQTFK